MYREKAIATNHSCSCSSYTGLDFLNGSSPQMKTSSMIRDWCSKGSLAMYIYATRVRVEFLFGVYVYTAWIKRVREIGSAVSSVCYISGGGV